MNFFSHHIRSLLHQDHGNPDTELSRHRHNGHPGSFTARMSVANQAEKLSELSVLSDRRPGSLDHFTSQAFISRAGDRTPIGSLSGGVLSGDQTQKPSQLADVSKLSPIADAGQKLTATIQPMPDTLIIYLIHWDNSGSFWQKRRISRVVLRTCFSLNSKLSNN